MFGLDLTVFVVSILFLRLYDLICEICGMDQLISSRMIIDCVCDFLGENSF